MSRQFPRKRHRFVAFGLRKENGELISADPCDKVRPADTAAQRGGERAKGLVATFVAMCVVDLLEIVDVEKKERERHVMAVSHRCIPSEGLVKTPPIREPGEIVSPSKPFELCDGLGVVQCDRSDIREVSDELDLAGQKGASRASPVEAERAKRTPARDQRDASNCLRRHCRAGNLAGPRIGVSVIGHDQLSFEDRSARDPLADLDSKRLHRHLVFSVHQRGNKLSVLDQLPDDYIVAPHQFAEIARDPREHRSDCLLAEQRPQDQGQAEVAVPAWGGGIRGEVTLARRSQVRLWNPS